MRRMYQDEDSAMVLGVEVRKEKNQKGEIGYKIPETAPITGFLFCNSETGKMVVFRQ